MSILRQSALLTAGAGHTGHPPVLTVVLAAWLSWATGNGTALLWQCRSRAGSPARPPWRAPYRVKMMPPVTNADTG